MENVAEGLSSAQHLTYWRDETGSADIEAARAADRDGKFEPVKGRTGFGIDKSPYWFRLDLYRPASSPDSWLIELPHPLLRNVQLYVPVRGDYIMQAEVGTHQVFNARPFLHRYFVFPVSLEAERVTTLYFRVQTPNTILMSARIWTPKHFAQSDDTNSLILGIYYGLILAMIAFNGFFFIKLKDDLFLFYIASSFFHMLSESELVGQNFQFLFPDNLWLANHQFVVAVPLATCMMMLFTCRFLELKTTHPHLNRLAMLVAGLSAITPVIGLAIDYSVAFAMTPLLSQLGMLVGIVAGIWRIREGYRPAIIFLIAEIPLQVGVIILGLLGEGIWPTEILAQQVMGVCSALEILLFSLALANRIALIRKEKQKLMEEIKANEERWRLAMESAGEGVWEWNVASESAMYSSKLIESLGYDKQEIVTKDDWRRLIPPAEHKKAINNFRNHLQGNSEEYRAEYRVKSKNGSWHWILAHGAIVERDGKGNPIRALGTHVDITERKRLEESVRELNNNLDNLVRQRTKLLAIAREEAELANASKSRFLSAASHDLRQPLAAAFLFIDTLKKLETTPEQKEAIAYLDLSMDNFRHLLDTLLDISKLDSGAITPEFTSIDVAGTFEALESIYAKQAGNRQN